MVAVTMGATVTWTTPIGDPATGEGRPDRQGWGLTCGVQVATAFGVSACVGDGAASVPVLRRPVSAPDVVGSEVQRRRLGDQRRGPAKPWSRPRSGDQKAWPDCLVANQWPGPWPPRRTVAGRRRTSCSSRSTATRRRVGEVAGILGGQPRGKAVAAAGRQAAAVDRSPVGSDSALLDQISRMVARGHVCRLQLAQFGIVGAAHVGRPRATGVEVAARRRVDGAGHVALEDQSLACGVELRDRGSAPRTAARSSTGGAAARRASVAGAALDDLARGTSPRPGPRRAGPRRGRARRTGRTARTRPAGPRAG